MMAAEALQDMGGGGDDTKIWCDVLIGAAKAKLTTWGDVLVNIRSEEYLTIPDKAAVVLGFLPCVGLNKPTAGISSMPKMRVTASQVGWSKEEITIPNIRADAIATHVAATFHTTPFIPLSHDLGKRAGGAEIEINVAASSAETEGYDFCVGVVMADQVPSDRVFDRLCSEGYNTFFGSDSAQSAAGISTASETNFTETIGIKGNASRLTNLLSAVQENAETEQDAATGYTDFDDKGVLDDFSPQRWPFGASVNSILGTPAAATIAARVRPYATNFPLKMKAFKMAVAQYLVMASGNAKDGIAWASWI